MRTKEARLNALEARSTPEDDREAAKQFKEQLFAMAERFAAAGNVEHDERSSPAENVAKAIARGDAEASNAILQKALERTR